MAHSASDGAFSTRWRIQRQLTSRPQDCVGNSGPNCNTLCSTQPVQGNGEICGWAHSFWFGTLHHPLSHTIIPYPLKQLKMYVYFFTNSASSPFNVFCRKIYEKRIGKLNINSLCVCLVPLFIILQRLFSGYFAFQYSYFYIHAFITHCFVSRKMQPGSIKALLAGIQFHLRCMDPNACGFASPQQHKESDSRRQGVRHFTRVDRFHSFLWVSEV